MPSSSPDRCGFYMSRKKRCCNLPSVPPSKFCSVHDPDYCASTTPCEHCNTPIKTSSTKAHLKVCPKALDIRRIESSPFFVRDVNLLRKPTVLACIPADCDALIKAVHRLHEEVRVTSFVWGSTGKLPPETDVVRSHWNNSRDSTVRYSEAHFEQNAALASLLFNVSGTVFGIERRDVQQEAQSSCSGVVELGAGRAYTSLFLAEILHTRGISANVVAVDRSCPRLGADRCLRNLETSPGKEGSRILFHKLKCDLKDLDLTGIAGLDNCSPIAIIGKHICGYALDLALVAIDRFARQHARRSPVSFALASCCRHRCAWQAAPAVQSIWKGRWTMSEQQFGAICRMSGWCLGCTDDDDSIRTGLLCQELVDIARVMWLREQGWKAHLVRYVERAVSPENLAIVGVWNADSIV